MLLTLLLAPYLREFGEYTVPDFVGDRYYSNLPRTRQEECPTRLLKALPIA